MYLLDFRTWIRTKWKIHPNFGAMLDYFRCNSNTHSVMGVWVEVSMFESIRTENRLALSS